MLPVLLTGLAAPPAGLIGWQASVLVGGQAPARWLVGDREVEGWARPGLTVGKHLRPDWYAGAALHPAVERTRTEVGTGPLDEVLTAELKGALGPIARLELRRGGPGGLWISAGPAWIAPEPWLGFAGEAEPVLESPALRAALAAGWELPVHDARVLGLALGCGLPSVPYEHGMAPVLGSAPRHLPLWATLELGWRFDL